MRAMIFPTHFDESPPRTAVLLPCLSKTVKSMITMEKERLLMMVGDKKELEDI